MAEKELANKEENNDEKKLYELTFHILPTFSEVEVEEKANEISSLVEKIDGVLKLSQKPLPRALAYEIAKPGAGKKEFFDNSFFGSFVFEAETSKIESLQKGLKKLNFILRYLLIEVPKETLTPKERRIPQSHKEEAKRTDTPIADAKPINEEELDKTIEQLVIE